MRFRRLFLQFAAPAFLSVLILSPALAQPAPATSKSVEGDQVVITQMPAQSSKVRAFLSRLLGKSPSDKSTAGGPEVLTVSKEKTSWLKRRLERLGCKVVHLGANWTHIFKRQKKEDIKLTPDQQKVVDNMSKSSETMNVGMIAMPNSEMAKLALTRFEKSVGTVGQAGPPEDRYAKVVLPLSETKDITLVRTRPPETSEKGVTWSGETEETGERAVLMLWADGHLSGYFGYKGSIFVVNHVGNQVHTMAEVDPRKLPPDHVANYKGNPANRDASALPVKPATPPPEPKVTPLSDAQRKALEAKKVTIDVMLLYTNNVGKHYVREPSDLMALAIEQANQTFRNSGVGNVSLRLVHSEAIDYQESEADQFDTLYRMVDGTGVFKGLRKLRDEKRADIVGLIVDDPSGCGLSTRVAAEADEAFFVVHHSCAAITYSLAHEIGHILGARHDRAVDGTGLPFPFGHGYVNATKWRDMMSYKESCNGCPRIPFWSNPRVSYKGEPTGTNASDNARVILEQAERVAKFR
jgi:hypothetical protein